MAAQFFQLRDDKSWHFFSCPLHVSIFVCFTITKMQFSFLEAFLQLEMEVLS